MAFQIALVLVIFWPLHVAFRKAKINPLDSALNFLENKPMFCRLCVLAKLPAFFQKF